MEFFIKIFEFVFAKTLVNKIISIIFTIILICGIYFYFFNQDMFFDIIKHIGISKDSFSTQSLFNK